MYVCVLVSPLRPGHGVFTHVGELQNVPGAYLASNNVSPLLRDHMEMIFTRRGRKPGGIDCIIWIERVLVFKLSVCVWHVLCQTNKVEQNITILRMKFNFSSHF